MELLSVGNSRRTCEPTAVNKTSSRSHAILQVVVEGRPRVMDISQEVKTGKLFMVDLAGSERAAQTKVWLTTVHARGVCTLTCMLVCMCVCIFV